MTGPGRLLRSQTAAEFNAELALCPPPTADDVSITMDGRVLDTAEKVWAFVAEIEAEREVRGLGIE